MSLVVPPSGAQPDFTYAPVGGTRDADAQPAGYRALRGRRVVGTDEKDLAVAAAFVLGFGMQRALGLDPVAVSEVAIEGLTVALTVGAGPARLRAPVRVVYVVDEPDRQGFAYGTLPGHPERGEELFLVERTEEGVVAEVRAFSRPAWSLLRVAGPAGRVAQRLAARRYLDACGRAVADARVTRGDAPPPDLD